MVEPAPPSPIDDPHPPHAVSSLGAQERALLGVLIAHRGRVVSRRELARHAGLAHLSERRCDSLIVGIRRVLGPEAIRTVRSRGWMLATDPLSAACAVGPADMERPSPP